MFKSLLITLLIIGNALPIACAQDKLPSQQLAPIIKNSLSELYCGFNIDFLLSETKKNKVLESILANTFNIPPNGQTRYYYNYIDLNDDGRAETIVYLVGPEFSGTGGSSALILSADNSIVSKLTLVRAPVLVSQHKTGAWKDLVLRVSGGGIPPFFATLKFDGTGYPSNPSIQPKLDTDSLFWGTALIADDLAVSKGRTY